VEGRQRRRRHRRQSRIEGVQVAGKTGSAQAMTQGKSDTIAWFGCFAPFEKREVCDRGDGAGRQRRRCGCCADRAPHHGARSAMDAGKFEQQVAWVEPANKPNPFQFLETVDFKDAGLSLADEDQENPPQGRAPTSRWRRPAQRRKWNLMRTRPVALPPHAAARRRGAARRPAPPPQPQRQPSFFQRLFGGRRAASAHQLSRQPPPQRRPGSEPDAAASR
jgi:hypothetical protein